MKIELNLDYWFPATVLSQCIDTIRNSGYHLLGPTLNDGTIVYGAIHSAADLPVGWRDEQAPGHYRLKKRDDDAYFGYVVPQHSWKKMLFPPEVTLFTVKQGDGKPEIIPFGDETGPVALLGVRACELQALAVLDRVLLQSDYRDNQYARRRQNLLVIAVNCGEPAGNCFCASMNTGPEVQTGYDLALTEVLQGQEHYFVVKAATEKGREILAGLPCREATEAESAAAYAVVSLAKTRMGKVLDTRNLKETLYQNVENPKLQEIEDRCMSCANCTMVCPTCFCTTVEDATDLSGAQAERRRKWDSCFSVASSYIHGGSVRTSGVARYRQWFFHKLAYWQDQFGMMGCVGCGRCITWCPVGIDLTEEAKRLQTAHSGATKTSSGEE